MTNPNKIKGKIQPEYRFSIVYNERVKQKPRKQRLKELLEKAQIPTEVKDSGYNTYDGHVGYKGIRIHCEGGMALKGDIKELLDKGYLELKRIPYSRVWGSGLRNPAFLRVTKAFITEKGREYLKTF